ncbi:uncharacterized protein LOC143034138 [Oratosquilla oratoria]|uniref:uncharacterized protein LOC143034138 n=1 Tax=Oratosquilla oratoria TaxID=337810 RepID=UPI003F760729
MRDEPTLYPSGGQRRDTNLHSTFYSGGHRNSSSTLIPSNHLSAFHFRAKAPIFAKAITYDAISLSCIIHHPTTKRKALLLCCASSSIFDEEAPLRDIPLVPTTRKSSPRHSPACARKFPSEAFSSIHHVNTETWDHPSPPSHELDPCSSTPHHAPHVTAPTANDHFLHANDRRVIYESTLPPLPASMHPSIVSPHCSTVID